MQIYIDSKYLGRAIRHGRCNAGIKARDAARVFGFTTREYNKIESGRNLAAPNMLERLMSLGFIQLHTRRFNGAGDLAPLKPNKNDKSIFISDN